MRDDRPNMPWLDMGPKDDFYFALISRIDDVPDDGVQLVYHATAKKKSEKRSNNVQWIRCTCMDKHSPLITAKKDDLENTIVNSDRITYGRLPKYELPRDFR